MAWSGTNTFVQELDVAEGAFNVDELGLDEGLFENADDAT